MAGNDQMRLLRGLSGTRKKELHRILMANDPLTPNFDVVAMQLRLS
jgi:hypothetical protein